jgi:hypothetical protein
MRIDSSGDVLINNETGGLVLGATARDNNAYFQNYHPTDTTVHDMYGIVNHHVSTGGGKNSTDHLVGITNYVEANNSSGAFGDITGSKSTAKLTDMSSYQGNILYGSYTEVSSAHATNNDLRNVYGSKMVVDIDGGEIDTDIIGNFIDLDVAATNPSVGGNVYGQYIKVNDAKGVSSTYGQFIELLAGVQYGIYQTEDGSETFSVGGGGAISSTTTSVQSVDYAEYFESKDGKAIAIGKTVKLDNGKVVPCEDGDIPLGVVRPKDGPGITLGAASFGWNEKFEKDDYDAPIYEDYTTTTWTEEITQEQYVDRSTDCECKNSLGGSITVKSPSSPMSDEVYTREHSYHTDRIPSDVTVPSDAIVVTHKQKRRKLNPNYDPSKEENYESRAEREEWCLIGLLGQIPITKGQPTASNWIKMKDVSDTVEMYFVK